MSRRSTAVAWTLFAIAALLMAAAFIFAAGDQTLAPTLAPGLIALFYGLVGALIASRRPENVIGWLLLLFSLLIMVGISTEQYAIYGLVAHPGSLPAAEWIVAPSFWVWVPALGILLIFIPLIFPDGKLLTPRWKWVAWFDGVVFGIGTCLLALNPDPNESYPGVRNPLAVTLRPELEQGLVIGSTLLLFTCAALSLVSFLLRFRRASTIERQQLKWVLFAVSFLVFAFVLNAILIDALKLSGLSQVMNIVTDAAILGLPAAIAIAILRHRLFDIDLILRRTVTYAIVVALLAIVYFGSVVLLQQIFANLAGLRENEIITVISTLAIAALFVPLRNWIQNAIDRRYYRSKYDAQKVLQDFGETVRDETDLEKLTGKLMEVVNKTMQPRSMSVWLKPTSDERRMTAKK